MAGELGGPYHDAVYAGQPAKEGQGYTDAQLEAFAKTAGITGSALGTWQQCVKSGQHTAAMTKKGTPLFSQEK